MTRRAQLILWMLILLGTLVALPATFLVARQLGVPDSVDGSTPWGKVLRSVLGVRRTLAYSNGLACAQEVFRVRGGSLPGIRHDLSQSGLVRGDYFGPDGSRLSRVRNGSGVAIYCRDNGYPSVMVLHVDGKPWGPSVGWHKNGTLRGLEFYDTEGLLHGLQRDYFPDGRRRSEMEYLHGNPVGTSTGWSVEGWVKEKFVYQNGHVAAVERYDKSGNTTQRLSFTTSGRLREDWRSETHP